MWPSDGQSILSLHMLFSGVGDMQYAVFIISDNLALVTVQTSIVQQDSWLSQRVMAWVLVLQTKCTNQLKGGTHAVCNRTNFDWKVCVMNCVPK